MILKLDRKALNNSMAKAMAGLAKDLANALDRTEQELGLNGQLARSIVVTSNTCTFKWKTKNESPSAVQLHEGAVIDGLRVNPKPWLTNALDQIDLANTFSKHHG
jgi:uncharacterized protein YaiL (DUF2058 family)